MNVDWTYEGCDADDERAIEQLWEEYQPELEAKLGELSLEPSELQFAITHDSESDTWNLQAALHLATHTLVTEHTGDSIRDVFDEVVADLARAVDEELSEPIEVSRRLQGLEAILPLLETNRAAGRSRQFFKFLGPLMQTLRAYTEREMELRELEAPGALEGVEVDDILDEALLRAWQRFDKRPRNVPFDLWLIALVHEVLDTFAAGLPHESLEQEREVALPEDDEQTSPITWVEQATYPETIELADLIPGDPGLDFWDSLDFETKQSKLAELLGGLTRDQRHILILHAVEGFELEEIAAIEERPVESIQADLEQARKQLAAALKKLQTEGA